MNQNQQQFDQETGSREPVLRFWREQKAKEQSENDTGKELENSSEDQSVN